MRGGDHDRDATLRRYAACVASSPHNLVSRRARGELLERHIPESVALADLVPAGTRRLLDLGTGGGLPGFVIAVRRPEIEVHLLDASTKKTSFLRDLARELEVPVHVHTGRAAELIDGELRGSFDVVTARAVAALVDLVPMAEPFLGEDGVLMAVKGARWEAEVRESAVVREQYAMDLVDHPVPGSPDPDPGSPPRVVTLRRRRIEPV
jgi:16S rRNA (guanine527-N7)-methyltransferase